VCNAAIPLTGTVFVLPAKNNVRKKYIPLSSFYAVRILTTKFEGYHHAMYQQIFVYTGDLSTRMNFDRLCISVCKTSVVKEKCIF